MNYELRITNHFVCDCAYSYDYDWVKVNEVNS